MGLELQESISVIDFSILTIIVLSKQRLHSSREGAIRVVIHEVFAKRLVE